MLKKIVLILLRSHGVFFFFSELAGGVMIRVLDRSFTLYGHGGKGQDNYNR